MMPFYYPLPGLFLRVPLLSFTDYRPASIGRVLQTPHFRLALYLASPGFYRLLEARNFDPGTLNEKELLSLKKYYNRMSYRPTPFGLFSSFTLTAWGDAGPILLPGPAGTALHLLPDQQVISLAPSLFSAGLLSGTYEPNPSLYRLRHEFRFIKTVPTPDSTRLAYALESLEANPLTRKLYRYLQQGARSGEAITDFLVAQTGCGHPDAAGYLAFLKEAQVIRSLQEPRITGPDFLLGQPAAGLPSEDLKALARSFHRLSARRGNPSLPALRQLAHQFEQLLEKHGAAPAEKYFYANSERKALQGGLPLSWQEALKAALAALAKLALPGQPELLGRFVRDFNGRFEGRKMALMEAMDPETGTGYGNFAEQAAVPAWLKDLRFPANEEPPTLPWSAAHRLLLEKWNALTGKDGVIRLQPGDLEQLPETGPGYPPSLSVIFRLTGNGMLIESAGGATGTSLIGRFTLFSEEALQLARQVAGAESQANPGVIFAEISLLSDTHTDNVNRRMAIYDYEIPINCISLLPESRQIRLDDLYVSVRNQEVILESRRLKKRVIPRLSSAYNFHHNHLAVFRFLCDLQYQALQTHLTFDLERYFPGMAYYPRVEFGPAVLSPAKWRVKAGWSKNLTVARLRETLQLPALVGLTRADQQLVFNLENEEDTRFFQASVSGTEDFTLQEYFLPADQEAPVMTTREKPVVNQFIAFFARRDAVYPPLPFVAPVTRGVKREFVLGSDWLYLKIYGSAVSADRLLVKRVLPVIRVILKQGAASWFFIRYADPMPHIRLRIKIKEGDTGRVIALFKEQFSDLVRDQLIREYQADTYRRELERYGTDLIEAAEEFFCASSELVLRFMKNNEKNRYTTDYFAISGFAQMLELMLPSLDEQVPFLQSVSQAFYREFNGDKAFRVVLDTHYRAQKQEFSRAVTDTGLYQALKMERCRDHFTRSLRELLARTAAMDENRKRSLLADLIHMHLNRVYPDQQRRQEMILYHCFHKYKLSQSAISGRSAAGSFALDH
ncbi:MAG: hypothetical protein JWQ66_4681 [Mucilaginibacter sp.]|nr:hypothetical protein [Mucilaginibacter sp.]